MGDIVDGEVETWIPPQPDNPLRFTGKVYVLVGSATYSSAVVFSNVVQDFGFGTIAGVGQQRARRNDRRYAPHDLAEQRPDPRRTAFRAHTSVGRDGSSSAHPRPRGTRSHATPEVIAPH